MSKEIIHGNETIVRFTPLDVLEGILEGKLLVCMNLDSSVRLLCLVNWEYM